MIISFGGRCSEGNFSIPANAIPASVCLLAVSNSSCHCAGVGMLGKDESLPIPQRISAKNISVVSVLWFCILPVKMNMPIVSFVF
jgi:hypothetical protein